jgi:hypothetical protein
VTTPYPEPPSAVDPIMALTKRALEILRDMAEGASIIYIDNDSMHGMRPVLCRGNILQKITLQMIDTLYEEDAIRQDEHSSRSNARDGFEITEKGRLLARNGKPGKAAPKKPRTGPPPLTKDERRALDAFKALATVWPQSLTIVWTSGLGLWVARTEEIDACEGVHDAETLCSIGTTIIPSTSGA